MIDALEPALERLPLGLSEAATAAREGADRTSKIGRANAWTASYIAEEQLIGNIDQVPKLLLCYLNISHLNKKI